MSHLCIPPLAQRYTTITSRVVQFITNTRAVTISQLPISSTTLNMADSPDSPQESLPREYYPRRDDERCQEEKQQYRQAEESRREEERRRYELRRQEEQAQEYAAGCRRWEAKAKEQHEAAKRHAAEARRDADWAQAATVVAVVAAASAFFRK